MVAKVPARFHSGYEVQIWLSLNDASSCLSLLRMFASVKEMYTPYTSDHAGIVRDTMTPRIQWNDETQKLKELVRCLRQDQTLINQRLPILLDILSINPPPDLPIRIDCDEIENDLRRTALWETERLREFCDKLIVILTSEVFSRGEVPRGWSGDWPPLPVRNCGDLADLLRTCLDKWMGNGLTEETDEFDVHMENRKRMAPQIKQLIINAKTATTQWGAPQIPDHVYEDLPPDQLYFNGVDCDLLECKLAEVVFVVSDFQAEKQLRAIAEAPPSERKQLIESGLAHASVRRKTKPKERVPEAKVAKIIDHLQANGKATGKELAGLVDVEVSTFYSHYVKLFPDYVKNGGGGYYVDEDELARHRAS